MNLSIILPIFNEEEIIRESVNEVLQKAQGLCKGMEIIAVNDGSNDNVAQVLQSLSRRDKRIKLVTHKKNKGYGAALKSGILKASYEWIFFIDADRQFDVKELRQFLPFIKKYDFIVGYRIKRADSLRRRFISYIYNKIVKILFGLPLKDVDCAFKLMRKSALQKMILQSNSFFISVELMTKSFKKEFKIKELGVKHFQRAKGESKVTFRQISLTLIDLIKLYRAL